MKKQKMDASVETRTHVTDIQIARQMAVTFYSFYVTTIRRDPFSSEEMGCGRVEVSTKRTRRCALADKEGLMVGIGHACQR
jgi:hypothetical protein